jgi:hypothetical protein
MKPSNIVVVLSALIVVLALIAAGTGLLLQDDGRVYTFTSLRGQPVQIYGQGLYRYDSFLGGAGMRGTDAATIVVEIPLLIVSLLLYRRGSVRGGLLLTGALGYFLYYYFSTGLGNAYNNMMLVYIALCASSLYAFILTLASFDLAALPSYFAETLPRRGIAIYLFAIGVILLGVWMPSIINALLTGDAGKIVGVYTTVVTYILDLAVVVPTTFLAGILLLRRAPLGYLLSSMLLVLGLALGVSLIAQGAAQLLLGVPLTMGEIIGFSMPFVFLTIVGFWPTAALFRSISEPGKPQALPLRTARVGRAG